MLFARPVRVLITPRRSRLVDAGSGGGPREVGSSAPSHLGLLKTCILLAVAASAVPPAADARASRSPVNLSPPSISGSATIGNTLKANDGRWRSSTGSLSISRNWLRCDAAGSSCVSAGWGGATYYLGSIDAGKRIRLRVTARNAFGSSSATSGPTVIVAAPTTAPPTAPAPTEPAPTVPSPTEPAPTDPAPTMPVYEKFAGFETGDWSEWMQLNTSGGSASIVTSPVAAGSRAGKLTVDSGSGNKYARGYFDISDWQIGSDHWFGARIYLPVGTYAALQGDMALMRWDNWALANMSQDQFGVWLHGTGTKGNLYLMLNNEQNGVDSILVDPGVKMAEGQWSCLEVRQKLGYDGDAISELWLNGTRLGSSTRQNINGGRRPVTLGYGVVAVNAGTQTSSLTAYVDQAYTARTRTGC